MIDFHRKDAPVELPDHATHVVRAALRCQHKLAEMRPAMKNNASLPAVYLFKRNSVLSV